jgi:N-acetylglucosamine kinase-like BadF-type ATPase
MKLIIEAGSSRTQSVLLSSTGTVVKRKETIGINPTTDPNYKLAVHKLISNYINDDIGSIYHYGSGCINDTVNSGLIYEYANNLSVSESEIKVYDDLYGSALSCCQDQSGIVVICGTGSISSYYDGRQLIDKVASGGYLIGDEGSGYDIGRRLIKRYIRQSLSPSEHAHIQDTINLSPQELISHIYTIGNVRRYMAQHCALMQHMSESTRREILSESFDSLYRNQIKSLYHKYPQPIHFVGSVGYHFRSHLKQLLEKNNILAGSFQASAIEGLLNYHRNG